MSVSDGLEFESDIQSDKPASESGNLATHLSQELKIVSDEEIATNEAGVHDIEWRFKLLSKSENEYKVNSPFGQNNNLKGCKWSPDGTCILTNSDDSILRLFDTNNDMIEENVDSIKELSPSLKMREPEIIYDYAWYPFMNGSDPTSACVFSTSKDNPVHLFDAYTGQIRCCYKGYNHLDELVSAYSIGFDSSGSKLFCGYNKSFKVFDISRPGKNFKNVNIKSDDFSIPGIISCIAMPRAQNGYFAIGSYSKYIGVFIESTYEPVCVIQGHVGGLTNLVFSPDGMKLYSGGRKDPEIYCWDMRNMGQVLQTFKREVTTNQRIYFDLSWDGRYLASGNTNGQVSIYDANESSSDPIKSWQAHSDCANGVGFHPSMTLFATSSGSRRITLELKKTSDSSSDESETESANLDPTENSLKIWKYE